MDLLEKFSAVEVKADNRIAEEDKKYCEQHQAAYEAARSAFQELNYIWSDIVHAQYMFLSGLDGSLCAGETYLSSNGGPKINNDSLKTHIMALHKQLIRNIIQYFNQKYHVSVSAEIIQDRLLPQKPRDRWDDKANAYEASMQSLQLHYQDILDQIFAQLDGRGLLEQALHELKEKCHNAAWNKYQNTAKYELKSETIRFPDYGCSYECWLRSEHWELRDGMKDIMRGLAHFETGSFSAIPSDLAPFIRHSRFETNQSDFSFCQKVCQIKMFKNGRVDLKFSSAEFAREFASSYLGTVY